ncbi:MAG: amidohydrolase family protein [Nanoarchaeota archaeon]|nr:amidohydrolase family protein [Nanoarchaeota archaeon]
MHKWSKYSITSENIGIYEEIFENVTIVDCHTHIGKDKDQHKLSPDSLIKAMNASKVNKAIILPLNDPYNTRDFNEPNDAVWLASKVYKDRLIPFFRLNPHFKWQDEFKLRLGQGFKGVKLHPRSQKFALTFSKAMKIYEACEKNNLVILIHTGFGLEAIADDLLTITKKFPALKLIIGHSGFVDLDNVIKKISKLDNVIFDTSSLRIFDLFDLLKKVDYHKISFGSDIPYYDIDLALEGVIDSAITVGKTPNQIRKILGGNILKWFR